MIPGPLAFGLAAGSGGVSISSGENALSLVLTAYLTRGWAAGVGTVLFFTMVVTIVIRYPCWWTFRAFSWGCASR